MFSQIFLSNISNGFQIFVRNVTTTKYINGSSSFFRGSVPRFRRSCYYQGNLLKGYVNKTVRKWEFWRLTTTFEIAVLWYTRCCPKQTFYITIYGLYGQLVKTGCFLFWVERKKNVNETVVKRTDLGFVCHTRPENNPP